MPETCPHCHQTIKPAKRSGSPLALASTVDIAAMSDAELFAYRQRTAPLEDVRFHLKNTRLSESLRAGFEALETVALTLKVNRPAFYREYHKLLALWRGESNRRERQAHLDAGHVLTPSGYWMEHDADLPGTLRVIQESEPLADSAVA